MSAHAILSKSANLITPAAAAVSVSQTTNGLNKVEWLILGALIVVSVIGWADLLQMYLQQDQKLSSQKIYATIVTIFTILVTVLILLFS